MPDIRVLIINNIANNFNLPKSDIWMMLAARHCAK